MKLSEKVKLYLADDKSVELTLCRWLIVQVKKYDATFINTHTNREQIVHTNILKSQFSVVHLKYQKYISIAMSIARIDRANIYLL